jgi:hypothetical protein
LSAILHYTDRIVPPYAPETVSLNAGGNDLKPGKNTPEKVCDMARAFSARIHTTLPDTQVYAIGLPHVLNASADPGIIATIKLVIGSHNPPPNRKIKDFMRIITDCEGFLSCGIQHLPVI